MSDSYPESKERRSEPRFKVNCRCWVEQDSMTLFGTVTNLSPNGLFLRTLPILNIGTYVDLKLNLEYDVIIARGEVRWRNKPVPSRSALDLNPPGLGILFTDLADGKDVLERYLQRTSCPPVIDSY